MIVLRKNIGKIAVFTALLTLTGVYGYYYAREWIAKWAFAHQTDIGVDELILIAISQTDLSPQTALLVNQAEFEWQGEMVDVLHREVHSDTLYIYGFRDAAETNLKQEAAWLYRNPTQPDSGSDTTKKRVKWLSPFVLPYSAKMASMGWSILVELQHFFSYAPPRIRLPVLEVSSPPPDL